MKVRVSFDLRDLWVGFFWKRELVPGDPIEVQGESLFGVPYAGVVYLSRGSTKIRTTVYVCLLPTLPLSISWLEDRRP